MRFSLVDDGIIKFDRSGFIEIEAIEKDEYLALEAWRKRLYQLELIGEYPIDKVGFGNISCKKDYKRHFQSAYKPQFLITGTQTGKYPDLDGRHYTRILDYDLDKNIVMAMGPVDASSETLTHAAIYETNNAITAIFHVHHKKMWNYILSHNLPHTKKETPYGTIEMAREAQSLFSGKAQGVFAMEGHEDGVIAFATTLDECGELILNHYHLSLGHEA
jgi:ribulose-5-phosphate 4-epimerase/fuculose-1-phosphate aldolase